MEEENTSLVEKIKKSTVVKVISGYAVIAFITVQIASLVSDSFGFGREFMQNIILGFFVVLPFIALIAWAASSRFGTLKILGISFLLLFTGYGTGSYIWVNNFILPGLEQSISEDNYVDLILNETLKNNIPFVKAIFPRSYVDVNRNPLEIDPLMVSSNIPTFLASKSVSLRHKIRNNAHC